MENLEETMANLADLPTGPESSHTEIMKNELSDDLAEVQFQVTQLSGLIFAIREKLAKI